MRLKRIQGGVLVFLLVILPCLGYAQASGSGKNEAVLLGFLQDLHSMSADFDQVVRNDKRADSSAAQRTHGQMALMRPGRFRWAVKVPGSGPGSGIVQRLIVINKSELWVYDADLMQVMHRSVGNLSKEATPAALLSGSGRVLMDQFKLQSTFFDKAVGWWFTLVPKSKQNSLSSLKLHFVQGELADMQFTDRLGRENQLHFTHRVMNPSLDNGLFKFIPPKGVDIVEEVLAP